jgi:hypothetical protein
MLELARGRIQENHEKLSQDGYYLRFEVFTTVTMKNVVFWDIKTQFVPHRRHTSLLQSPAS